MAQAEADDLLSSAERESSQRRLATEQESNALRTSARREAEQLLASANREVQEDRKSTRLNSSHANISYAVFCLKKKKKKTTNITSPSCLIKMHCDIFNSQRTTDKSRTDTVTIWPRFTNPTASDSRSYLKIERGN